MKYDEPIIGLKFPIYLTIIPNYAISPFAYAKRKLMKSNVVVVKA